MQYPKTLHRGAVIGVACSCHQFQAAAGACLQICCDLFQGVETFAGGGADSEHLAIEFPLEDIRALATIGVHNHHSEWIPHLPAAGCNGPVQCCEPSARQLQ